MTSKPSKLQLQLRSQTCCVEPVCLQIADLLQQHGLSGHLFAVELVARELLNNAILHGNNLSPDTRVGFCMTIGRRWICLQVTDEGEGYDWRRIRRELPDPDATCGRGINIARLYAQKLTFGDDGRRIEARFDRRVVSTPC